MRTILNAWQHLGNWLKQTARQWTKPATIILVANTWADMGRSRADLIVENAMLRQQLIVLNRQVKQPHFTQGDRIRLVLLARCSRFWQQALYLVQPDTLLHWHRALFRFYWRLKSRNKERKPRLAQETIDLIKQMTQREENRLWGAERIRGELLKLGIEVSKRTIQKYMTQARQRRSGQQTWATFLKNHARDIWACDGRPFGRLVNISKDMIHHQGWISSPWRLWEPSNPKLVSFQGTSASREVETDRQDANVQERMGWG